VKSSLVGHFKLELLDMSEENGARNYIQGQDWRQVFGSQQL
jgi:hypothetical protein